MADSIYISEQIVKDLTPVDNNVDPKLIKSSIIYAEDNNIVQTIGSKLHQTLSSEIQAGTLSANNRILIDNYICKAHVAWTLVYLTFDLLVRYRNKSLMTNNSEYGSSAEYKLLIKAEERTKEKAEFYTERLIQYLKANTDIYPDYLLSTGKSDNISPDSNNYFSGIYLPDCNCHGNCNCGN
jgi:hypothetical protein